MTDENNDVPTEAQTENTGESVSALFYPPEQQVMESLRVLTRHLPQKPTLKDQCDMMQSSLFHDENSQNMLYAQLYVLDTLFHSNIANAMNVTDENGNKVKDYVSSRFIDLALRTQKQCRTTIEALQNVRDRNDKDQEKFYKQTNKDWY